MISNIKQDRMKKKVWLKRWKHFNVTPEDYFLILNGPCETINDVPTIIRDVCEGLSESEWLEKWRTKYSLLTSREYQEIKHASIEDEKGNPLEMDGQKQRAIMGFEQQIANFFTQNQINFITEKELLENWDGTGTLVTPDFVFETPILVNGRETYWIDAKSSYGPVNIGPFYRLGNTKKQGEKYNKKFGPGAFFYRLGFSENFESHVGTHVVDVHSLSDLVEEN